MFLHLWDYIISIFLQCCAFDILLLISPLWLCFHFDRLKTVLCALRRNQVFCLSRVAISAHVTVSILVYCNKSEEIMKPIYGKIFSFIVQIST